MKSICNFVQNIGRAGYYQKIGSLLFLYFQNSRKSVISLVAMALFILGVSVTSVYTGHKLVQLKKCKQYHLKILTFAIEWLTPMLTFYSVTFI